MLIAHRLPDVSLSCSMVVGIDCHELCQSECESIRNGVPEFWRKNERRILS